MHGEHAEYGRRKFRREIDTPPHAWGALDFACSSVDYPALAAWCRSRRGTTIVCEASGADWLPFRDIGEFQTAQGVKRTGKHREAVWVSPDPHRGESDA